MFIRFDQGVFAIRVFGYGFVISPNELYCDRANKRKRYFGHYIRPIKP